MDKLSLPFTAPTVGTETKNRPPTPSLLKLASDTKFKLAVRPPTLSLFKLANDKKLKLLDQESLTLPSTVSDLKKDEATTSEPVPLSAYFLLASAVISLSFIAPLLDLQDADPIMKIVWRQIATTMLLAVMAASTCIREGSCGINDAPPSAKSWGYTILAGVFYSPLCIVFSMALEYTTVEDAVAFSNTQSLLILAGKVIMGSTVSLRQSMGALAAFGGAIFCNLDSDQMMMTEFTATTDADSNSSSIEGLDARVLYGDVLGFASSFFGVGYLLLSKEARTEISLFPFMFVVMLSATIVSNLTAFAMGKPLEVWSMDEDWGAFGFLHWNRFDRLPLEIITVIICNVFGTMGYIRALRYFDPLVVSVAALSEPVVAQFLAALAQVGLLPGWRGWIGNALIAIGTYWVAYQPPEKKEEMQKHALGACDSPQ
mmetsp:Transcript_23940/g.58510  ORF Transcript_23940/g.58510 Transcript_23940/m.58510 type:complete len:429 (+) Transcript_23940:250-1536(+)